MEVKEKEEITDKLLESLSAAFFKEELRHYAHYNISAFLYPRWFYWFKKSPKRPSKGEVLYFLSGRAHEFLVGRTELLEPGYVLLDEGVIGHTDFTLNGILVEFKSTRSQFTDEINELYIETLKSYLSLNTHSVFKEKTKGYLIIYFLAVPTIRVYEVEFTEEELSERREQILKSISDLKKALREGREEDTSPCPKWRCKNCRYIEDCSFPKKQAKEEVKDGRSRKRNVRQSSLS